MCIHILDIGGGLKPPPPNFDPVGPANLIIRSVFARFVAFRGRIPIRDAPLYVSVRSNLKNSPKTRNSRFLTPSFFDTLHVIFDFRNFGFLGVYRRNGAKR